ncbi:MAG: NAD(+)/NADH kinase [Bacteroidales bacterium]|nr:NAD(+)/NADH kinase [Bacteroidales bacterium]
MKAALFGKRIDKTNIGKLILFVNNLKEYRQMEFCYHSSFYSLIKEFSQELPQGGLFNSHEDLPADTDIFLSLGGDGTFLESLTMVRDREIPIAGINFGRLGFLTTACVEENNPWIEKLINGDFAIEERTVLHLVKEDMPEGFYPYAINEMTIQRTAPSMLEVDVLIDGNRLPKYWSDGILVATATGSTAYSLSVGGPVVTPDSKVLIIAPISPHNLNVRPLVVPDSSTVEISFNGRSPKALLTVDNRSQEIMAGERIIISKGSFPLKAVSINNNFIAALNQKLLWGEDKRNMQ